MGVWIIDGDCKASATKDDKGFMVLNCLDQLVTQDVALCMLTTSNQFEFYRSKKMEKCIETTFWTTKCYSQRQVGKDDIYKDTDWLQKLPTHLEEIPVAVLEGEITNEMAKWPEYDVSTMASWKSLRSELKSSCMQCQM